MSLFVYLHIHTYIFIYIHKAHMAMHIHICKYIHYIYPYTHCGKAGNVEHWKEKIGLDDL